MRVVVVTMMIHRNPDTDGGRVEVFSPVGAVVIAVDYDFSVLSTFLTLTISIHSCGPLLVCVRVVDCVEGVSAHRMGATVLVKL